MILLLSSNVWSHYDCLIAHKYILIFKQFPRLGKVTLFQHTTKYWPTGKNRWIKIFFLNFFFEQWKKTQDSDGKQRYGICTVNDQQPNAWLRSGVIRVPSSVKKVYIAFVYNTKNCTVLQGDNFCKEYFDLYVHQSGASTVPDPLQNNTSYVKIAEITAPILGIVRTTKTFGVEVKGDYIVLAFNSQGSCSSIYSVIVSYYVCSTYTVASSLVSLPRSIAPANDSVPVLGHCVTTAVYHQGILSVDCQSDGVWNISSLKGRCICKESKENRDGECKGTSCVMLDKDKDKFFIIWRRTRSSVLVM